MKPKDSVLRIIFIFVNTVFLALFSILCVVPFIHLFGASVSDPYEVMRTEGLILWPKGFNIEGYKLVFKKPLILSGYKNTLFVTAFGTFISLLMTCFGAYVLSQHNVYWNKLFMKMITITMFISGGLIPFYLLIDNIGLNGSIWALILPYCLNTWNMMVMRSAFRQIPGSVQESARMDGASEIRILFAIAIPLTIPTIAVMVLFYGLGYWNSWFPAVIFLRDRSKFPLQLIMREILIQENVSQLGTATELQEAGAEYYLQLMKYTTIILATVPIMCIYPFLQKYFVKGVMVGSLKE